MSFKATLAFLTLAFMVALSACSSDPTTDNDNGKMAASLSALAQERLKQDGLSDWDRRVLEKTVTTGSISQADYDEGADNFEACINAAGQHWVRTRLLNGVAEFQPPTGSDSANDDGQMAATIQWNCYSSTYLATQELFAIQQANPELLSNYSIAAVNCLRRAGMVGEEFTAEDFDKAMGPKDTPVTDWPFDVMDARAQTCLYSLGYAITTEAK